MKKLEKEQLPKVIALGAMIVLLLGYAGFTWLGHGGSAPAPAAASTPHPAAPPAATAAAQQPDPVMALSPIDHENPFIPVFQATTSAPKPAPAVKPPAPVHPAAPPAGGHPAPQHGTAAPAAMMASLPDTLNGPAMDGLPGVVLPPSPAAAPRAPAAHPPAPRPGPASAPAHPAGNRPAPGAKPAAAAPQAPAVVVTGILEGQENVAILKWSDSHGQVVRTGDRLDGGYVVKEIRPDAVVLTLGSRQWEIRLGHGN